MHCRLKRSHSADRKFREDTHIYETRVITFDQHLVLIKAIQVFSIEGFQYVDVLYDAIAPQEPLNVAIGFFGSAWSIGQSLRLYL